MSQYSEANQDLDQHLQHVPCCIRPSESDAQQRAHPDQDLENFPP